MFKTDKIGTLIIILVMMAIGIHTNAQMTGWVEVPVSVSGNNRPIENADVEVMENGVSIQTYNTKANGNVTVKLNLNKQCKIYFKKTGFVTKYVEYNTIVPENEKDQIIPAAKFAIELFEDKGDLSQKEAVTKPVAKYIYNTTYEDFVFDDTYSKQVKAELEQARKEAEALARQRDKARLDSLNKVWNDSLLHSRDRDAKILAAKAEQDRLRKELEKAKQDSIAKANADAKTAADLDAKDRARKDSIARAEVEKARLDVLARKKSESDSLAKLEFDKKKLLEVEKARLVAEAREKARVDSMARADIEKLRLDSLASIKSRAELLALAKQKEQARQDSLYRAEAARKERLKFVSDSTAKADAEKAKALAQAKAKADDDARATEAAKRDSLAKADASLRARQKFVTDSTAKAEADKTKAEVLARLQADAETKALATVRRDSISKAEAIAKNRYQFIADSTARAAAEKLRSDALAKTLADAERARQKAITDSTSKANAEKVKQDALVRAKAEADSKAEALTKEQERKDLLARVEAEKARQKFVSDSTAKAIAEKEKQEAIAKAKLDADTKAKADAEVLAKEKERKDALAKAEAEKNRQKFIADSSARAMSEKARLEEIAKNKAEAEAKAKAESDQQKSDKLRADSIAFADRIQKEKDDAERKAKTLAEIQAKKDLLIKSYGTDDSKSAGNTKPTTSVPKIISSDYKEGVTEETVTETNRTIYRVVVKKEGATNNYQKIVYKWGGVFYFKNESSITETTYVQEIKNAKAVLKD